MRFKYLVGLFLGFGALGAVVAALMASRGSEVLAEPPVAPGARFAVEGKAEADAAARSVSSDVGFAVVVPDGTDLGLRPAAVGARPFVADRPAGLLHRQALVEFVEVASGSSQAGDPLGLQIHVIYHGRPVEAGEQTGVQLKRLPEPTPGYSLQVGTRLDRPELGSVYTLSGDGRAFEVMVFSNPPGPAATPNPDAIMAFLLQLAASK